MTLRIYADFNSCMEDDRGKWCWCLRYEGKILDECENDLQLRYGMAVTLFYEDDSEEFEFDAVLGHVPIPEWCNIWMALIDDASFRRIR